MKLIKVDFNKQLTALEQGIAECIWQIRGYHDTIEFFTVEDLKKEDFEADCLEMRNSVTGNVFDVHLMSIDESGLRVVRQDDLKTIYRISINELSEIRDRISLYEMLYEKCYG